MTIWRWWQCVCSCTYCTAYMRILSWICTLAVRTLLQTLFHVTFCGWYMSRLDPVPVAIPQALWQARLVVSSQEPVMERESLASSPRRTYRATQSDYLAFVQAPPIPALVLYTAQLSNRLTHSLIRTYLSAVRNLHVMNGVGDPVVGYLIF